MSDLFGSLFSISLIRLPYLKDNQLQKQPTVSDHFKILLTWFTCYCNSNKWSSH